MAQTTRLIVFFLFLTTLSQISYAPTETCYGSGCDSTNRFDQNDPSAFDYSSLDADISSVPPEHLDFGKLQQYDRVKELTADQLAYQGEDGGYNLDKANAGKTSKEAYDSSLEKLNIFPY